LFEDGSVILFGDNSNILLNISLLFQGYRTDAQLSELLTDFSNDFYKDGTIVYSHNNYAPGDEEKLYEEIKKLSLK
jgi:hypothetical protein